MQRMHPKERFFWMQKLLISGVLGSETPEGTPKFYSLIQNMFSPLGGSSKN